jgi:non-ribosomal peptide synthetase component F
VREHRVTVVTFPPSYLHLFDKEPFPGLRVLITAGEAPITDDALHYAKELAYFNAYGPTEACVCSSMKRVLPDEKPPLSAGTVIPNGSAYILDAQGRFLPAGMTGELHIGGASLACGYYRNEALTAARFRTLPSGERIYATASLRRYKDKFGPVWMPMWLVVPSPRRLPGALRALTGAYCPDGMVRALRRNG